jgi:hypothetical protein
MAVDKTVGTKSNKTKTGLSMPFRFTFSVVSIVILLLGVAIGATRDQDQVEKWAGGNQLADPVTIILGDNELQVGGVSLDVDWRVPVPIILEDKDLQPAPINLRRENQFLKPDSEENIDCDFPFGHATFLVRCE